MHALADYTEALKVGEVPAAYARLMFLGAGGPGKSSLLDGLMNIQMRIAESTALADTMSIKYHWVEAADAAEDACMEGTHRGRRNKGIGNTVTNGCEW